MALNQRKTEAETDRYYMQKAKSSFKARFDLLLYHRITNDIQSDITTDDFERFVIKDNLQIINEYVQVYWQKETDYEIRGKRIDDIYMTMKKWQEIHKPIIDELQKYYLTKMYEKIFPRKDFTQMLKDGKECHYCRTSEDQILRLIEEGKLYKKHITRGWSLEIDRKEPNLEYTKDNCVMCCYWCNNAKTDEFRHEEFIEIGKAIENIWHERLKSR